MLSDVGAEPPVIWRTKLRSLKPGVDHVVQVDHCLNDGLVGIGWGIDGLPSGAPLTDVVLAAIASNTSKGWGRRAAATVRQFGADAQRGDFVWTRDLHGRFRLGKIVGDYRYENDRTAQETDTHQVRRAEWSAEPLSDLRMPGAVIRAFSGPASSFDRISNHGARRYTGWLWEMLHGGRPASLKFSKAEVLRQLEPYDLEDLVYTWMQVSGGYLALPKARRTDTPAYEWTMLHRTTEKPAIVQVKSGHDQAVDLEALAAAAPDAATTVFAFSAAGLYSGDPARPVIKIASEDLLRLVDDHPGLLPPRVRAWFDLASSCVPQ